MNPLAEDDFLEKLMPELRRQRGAHAGPCPDSKTLASFSEDHLTPSSREMVIAHLRQCRQCAEICARLANFNNPAAEEHSTEWLNAQKRLDNWMDGFLRGHEAATQHAYAQPTVLSKNSARSSGFSWNMRWAFGLVPAVVILATVGWIELSKQVGVEEARKNPIVVSPGPQQSQAPNQSNDKDAESSSQLHDLAPVAVSQGTPHSHNAEAVKKSQPAQETTSAEAAQVSVPTPPYGATMSNADLPANSSSRSKQPAAHRAAMANAALPSSLRIKRDTHLWISLDHAFPEDGRFAFRGKLVGPFPLDVPALKAGTEVSGNIVVSRGEMTVQVTGIVVDGTNYSLPAASWNMSKSAPGSGWAQAFDEGRELEMQLTADDSVYESPAGGGGWSGHNYAAPARSLAPAAPRPTPKTPPAQPIQPQN